MPYPNLAFAQARAERTMSDHVTIVTPPDVEKDAFDYQTGNTTPATPTVLYSGKCHLSRRGRDLLPHKFEEGDQNLNRIDYILSIPIGSPVIPQGAIATIDGSARSANLIGKVGRIRSARFQTHEVENQFDVEFRDEVS